MKTFKFYALILGIVFFTSCGEDNSDGSETGAADKNTEATEAEFNPEEMAQAYCECLEKSESTDSCSQMSINHSVDLAMDEEALATYQKITEECSEKRMEQDMNNAMGEVDQMMEDVKAEE